MKQELDDFLSFASDSPDTLVREDVMIVSSSQVVVVLGGCVGVRDHEGDHIPTPGLMATSSFRLGTSETVLAFSARGEACGDWGGGGNRWCKYKGEQVA
ncbi:hypothetical protein Pcinc_028441 [Petrolisthes cinctipes]|uniref:Uncharacterized protein n=1 Tax=Petrolisthes cinctipes TaxID=88211 RepID=A0AAE1K7A0_PETCI|nr:hypothetical protein Pcinc_028441 [Petrolisthes cinctipes]